MPIGMPSKEAKAEIETHSVTTKVKFKAVQNEIQSCTKPFCVSYSSIHFGLLLH